MKKLSLLITIPIIMSAKVFAQCYTIEDSAFFSASVTGTTKALGCSGSLR